MTPGLAFSPASPQPGMVKSHYKSDYQRYHAARHVAHCTADECQQCQRLCDQGLVIDCDSCGRVHHTDWLGWYGKINNEGQCSVFCPECKPDDAELVIPSNEWDAMMQIRAECLTALRDYRAYRKVQPEAFQVWARSEREGAANLARRIAKILRSVPKVISPDNKR